MKDGALKTPITVRIEADLLKAVRDQARQENRTLTNFIETVLRRKVVRASPSRAAGRPVPHRGPSDVL